MEYYVIDHAIYTVRGELTLVLLVERAVATPPAEGVGLGVPLTAHRKG